MSLVLLLTLAGGDRLGTSNDETLADSQELMASTPEIAAAPSSLKPKKEEEEEESKGDDPHGYGKSL